MHSGCLSRGWFKACGPASPSMDDGDFCGCLLYNTGRPSLSEEETQICATINNDTECCGSILNRLLGFYRPVSAIENECTSGFDPVFIDPDDLQGSSSLQPDGSKVYIVPSFKFSCSGCIERVELLVDSVTNPSVLMGDVFQIFLLSEYEPISPGSPLYQQRRIFNISVMGTIETLGGNLKLSIPVFHNKVCFNSGDVFGFSVRQSSPLRIKLEPEADGVTYSVPLPEPNCNELQGIFEPEDSPLSGLPQIALMIGECFVNASMYRLIPTVPPSFQPPLHPSTHKHNPQVKL